jgi:TonB family protein
VEFSKVRVLYQPPPPPYPPLAKIAKIQGTVVVAIVVNPDGLPVKATAIEGPPQLRPAAESYAMKWKFEPVRIDGKTITATFSLSIPFRLSETQTPLVQRVALSFEVTDPVLEEFLEDLRTQVSQRILKE